MRDCCPGFAATDPKDQIYAFVSLATDGQSFEIDYGKTEVEVFTEFNKYVLKSNDLTVRNLAGLCQDKNACLPSWVPSWRSRLPYRRSYAQFEEPLVPLAEGWIPNFPHFRLQPICYGFSASGDSTASVNLKESDEQRSITHQRVLLG